MEPKSKTQIKREMHELQELGKRLVELSPEHLGRIDMPEKLKEAVLLAKTIKKHGALSRQLHYIGAVMREIDPGPIREALGDDDETRLCNLRIFKQAELWRDALIEGDEKALDEIFELFPAADSQQLRQLMRNGQKEKEEGRAPKSSRSLFRFLKALLDGR